MAASVPELERQLDECARQLRASEQRFNAVVARSPDGILIADEGGIVRLVNPAAERLLGRPADRLVGLRFDYRLTPGTTVELDYPRRQGEALVLEMRVAATEWEGEAAYLASLRDIAAHKRVEEAERAQRTLAEALRDTTAVLNSTLRLDEILDGILSNMGRVVPHDAANIMLVDEEGRAAHIVRRQGRVEPGQALTLQSLRFVVDDFPSLRRMRETGQPLAIPDTYAEADWIDRRETHWIRSYASAPIRARDGQVIGFLNLNSASVGFYTQMHAERLQAFANQAANAIENARLYETQRVARERAETLQAATQALSATLDLQEVFDLILSELRKVMPYDSASVQRLIGDELEIIGGHGFPNLEELIGVRFDLIAGNNPNREVVRTRGPVIVGDAPTRYGDFHREPHAQAGIRAWLGVPLLFGDRLIGMIALDKQTPGFYTEDHARLAAAFAAQAAVAIENARLYEAAQQRLAEQAALLAASNAVSSSLDLDTVFTRLAEQMGKAIDATSVYIGDWDPATNNSTVLAEYYGPQASQRERVSDLGVTYDLDQDFGQPESRRLLQGQVIVRHIDDPGLSAFTREHLSRYGGNSVLNVPLIVKDKVVGHTELWDSRRRRDFSPDEIALCRGIAQQAAVAFENARLFEAERQRRQELEGIYQANLSLTASLDLPQVLDAILRAALDMVPLLDAHIFLYDGQRLTFGATAIAEGRTGVTFTEPRPDGLTYTVGRTGETIIVEDSSRHPLFEDAPADWKPFAIVGLPLKIGATVIGVINVAYPAPRRFTESELRILNLLAAQAAIAIQNAQLHEQVQRHAGELEQRVVERTVELESQRQRMQAILDAAGDGILFTDLDWTIEYVNPAMERITGYTASEAQGHSSRLWRSGLTPRAVYDEMNDSLRQGQVWHGELINRRKDGTLYDAALTVSPLRSAGGEIVGLVVIHRDVTRQKDFDRLRDQFVSNVSHELRTPLANVKLYLDLLEHGRPDKREQYMQTLNRETSRLERLIVDLLDLSRLDLDTITVDLRSTDLNQLASDLIVDRTTLAAESGLSLERHAQPDLPKALVDPAMIAQVMSNLMDNAVNYTPRGGAITLTTAVRQQDGRDWVTFTVRDTGPGISAADQSHLFERFFRGESGRNSGAPGTGLGLAICKEIVDKLDGRITVESQPGQGSAFTVWLKPAREADA